MGTMSDEGAAVLREHAAAFKDRGEATLERDAGTSSSQGG